MFVQTGSILSTTVFGSDSDKQWSTTFWPHHLICGCELLLFPSQQVYLKGNAIRFRVHTIVCVQRCVIWEWLVGSKTTRLVYHSIDNFCSVQRVAWDKANSKRVMYNCDFPILTVLFWIAAVAFISLWRFGPGVNTRPAINWDWR